MIRTIELSNHISVQGVVVRKLRDGRTIVRDGRCHYIGQPVRR